MHCRAVPVPTGIRAQDQDCAPRCGGKDPLVRWRRRAVRCAMHYQSTSQRPCYRRISMRRERTACPGSGSGSPLAARRPPRLRACVRRAGARQRYAARPPLGPCPARRSRAKQHSTPHCTPQHSTAQHGQHSTARTAQRSRTPAIDGRRAQQQPPPTGRSSVPGRPVRPLPAEAYPPQTREHYMS